jgi:hypothetical protein
MTPYPQKKSDENFGPFSNLISFYFLYKKFEAYIIKHTKQKVESAYFQQQTRDFHNRRV